jgi:hypothetical protein
MSWPDHPFKILIFQYSIDELIINQVFVYFRVHFPLFVLPIFIYDVFFNQEYYKFYSHDFNAFSLIIRAKRIY